MEQKPSNITTTSTHTRHDLLSESTHTKHDLLSESTHTKRDLLIVETKKKEKPSEEYLKAHSLKEEEVINILQKMHNEFRVHYDFKQTQLEMQKELLDRMWVLSKRYVIFLSTESCCSDPEKNLCCPPNPEIPSLSVEHAILNEYNEKMNRLRASNNIIMQSFNNLTAYTQKFEEAVAQLDMSIETPFIVGDTFHKPISFLIEIVADIQKYFHNYILKLKYHAHQLDPSDPSSIENYKAFLPRSEDFEQFLEQAMIYCKCFRQKPVC